MNLTRISLVLGLSMLAGATYAQEFVVSQTQANKEVQCQENCAQESQAPLQIDRSGMDKASVHLQIMQQTSPRFTEGSGAPKKSSTEEKKPNNTKTQENN